MFWNIQRAQVLSRTERVRTRKWKAVAEVVQLKQRERDFLPWKLHLFWIYTNYLLTFDQQLLEHLFQVLQEKKIIFKSTGEVRTRWQGMTSFFRYALILKNQFLSSIVTQSKASWHIRVPHQPRALPDYGLRQLGRRNVKRNPAEENCRETARL